MPNRTVRKLLMSEDGLTARVPLTRGLFAVIDAADVPTVSAYNWHVRPSTYSFYAWSYQAGSLHGLLGCYGWDHINRDGLDNRRCNLRPANRSEQAANQRVYKNNTTGTRGVMRYGTYRYRAQIKVNGQMRFLGSFYTVHEAQAAYDVAAREAFGEFYVPQPPVEDFPPHGKCDHCGTQLAPPKRADARFCDSVCAQRARRLKARRMTTP